MGLKIIFKTIFLVAALQLCTPPLNAQATQTSALRVGVTGGEPFVFTESDKGISVEIWDKIADKQSWEYNYLVFENVEDALSALSKGELDLVVGPISITAKRLETMRFSQPFYNSRFCLSYKFQTRVRR